jgi:hypothetical protein
LAGGVRVDDDMKVILRRIQTFNCRLRIWGVAKKPIVLRPWFDRLTTNGNSMQILENFRSH